MSLVALVVAVATAVMCALCCHKHAATTGGVDVEAALLAKPEMVINALNKYEENARQQQAQEAEKLVKENLSDMHNDADTPFIGPKDAKVTLVEFFDYSCGYCQRLFPELKRVVEANPDVKFVFKPLTFLGENSVVAAKAVLAAAKQGKFMEVHNALFEAGHGLTKEKIRSIAEEKGLDMAQFDAYVASAEVSNILAKISELAGKVRVNGVPAMFINGTMLQTLNGNDVQNAINDNK